MTERWPSSISPSDSTSTPSECQSGSTTSPPSGCIGACAGSTSRIGSTLPPFVVRRSHGRGLRGSGSSLSKPAKAVASLPKRASRRLEWEAIEETSSSGTSEPTSTVRGGLASSLTAHLISASAADPLRPLRSSTLIESTSSVKVDSPQSRLNRRQVESSVLAFRDLLTLSLSAPSLRLLSASLRRG